MDVEGVRVGEPYGFEQTHIRFATLRGEYDVVLFLDEQSRAYVQRTSEVQDDDEIEVSQIFEWFEDDFGGEQGVRDFLREHLSDDQNEELEDYRFDLEYFEYDWDINARD